MVKEAIQKKHGIVVHFSNEHDYYISAYRHFVKKDRSVVHSEGHPNLTEAKSPPTKKSIAANRRCSKNQGDSSKGAGATSAKRRRLSGSNVASYIRENNIYSYTELMAAGETRRLQCLKGISEYIYSHSEKNSREVLMKSWQMQEAPQRLERDQLSREQIVEKALGQSCASQCNKLWLQSALEVLSLNNLNQCEFASALTESLFLGRRKFRNLLLVGPTNCAKSFMFKPLKSLFGDKVFENPSCDKFGWVRAEKASVILLQDYRWSKESIQWKDLLLLLEGETVKLLALKNMFAEDVTISTNVAIFATSKSPITYRGPYNPRGEAEDAMMHSRWNLFQFSHQFPQHVQKDIAPCGRCFAELISMRC